MNNPSPSSSSSFRKNTARRAKRTSGKQDRPKLSAASSPIEPLEGRLLFSNYTVTTLGDSAGAITSAGTGKYDATTLRAAITAANAHAGTDTIDFAVTGSIDLKTALPWISDNLIIDGPGASKLTVRQSAAATTDFSIFYLNAGKTSTISGLTISGGGEDIPANNGPAGGIFNDGNITIAGSIISHNFNYNGGGGILSEGGNVTVSSSTISDNSATYGGGGIEIDAGTLALIDSTVSGNSSFDGGGAGILNQGTITVTGSTISGNTSVYIGGSGIFNTGDFFPSRVTITNSTISGNSSSQGEGAGIFALTGTVSLDDSTVSGNSSPKGDGGGLCTAGGTVSLANTIVAGNSSGANGPDVFGKVASGGFNLVGKTDGSTGWKSTDHLGTAAKPLNADLGPLANNGGPTQTLLPLAASPALGAGSVGLIAKGVTADQRGLPRVVCGKVDHRCR